MGVFGGNILWIFRYQDIAHKWI